MVQKWALGCPAPGSTCNFPNMKPIIDRDPGDETAFHHAHTARVARLSDPPSPHGRGGYVKAAKQAIADAKLKRLAQAHLHSLADAEEARTALEDALEEVVVESGFAVLPDGRIRLSDGTIVTPGTVGRVELKEAPSPTPIDVHMEPPIRPAPSLPPKPSFSASSSLPSKMKDFIFRLFGWSSRPAIIAGIIALLAQAAGWMGLDVPANVINSITEVALWVGVLIAGAGSAPRPDVVALANAPDPRK